MIKMSFIKHKMSNTQETTWYYMMDIHKPDNMFFEWGKKKIPQDITSWVIDPFSDVHYIGKINLKFGR